jgi:hypothetical protein
MASYKKTLWLKAQPPHQTPEKLRDGKFYYLVEESTYNELNLLRLRTRENTGMWQDAAGTTPVTAVEQPVGLWLDRDRRTELDASGAPKLPMTLLEQQAVEVCNMVKAWADSDRRAPFPVEAHMGADLVLGMAQLRRKGVQ